MGSNDKKLAFFEKFLQKVFGVMLFFIHLQVNNGCTMTF